MKSFTSKASSWTTSFSGRRSASRGPGKQRSPSSSRSTGTNGDDDGPVTVEQATHRLCRAADLGDVAAVNEAMALGAKIDQQDEEGRCAIIWAAKNGHTSCVETLINWRANVDLTTRHDATALGLAAWRGFPGVMRVLLEAGAQFEFPSKTPLMWACETGQLQALELLIEWRASINPTDGDGTHALSICARKGHAELVQVLASQLSAEHLSAQEAAKSIGVTVLATHWYNVSAEALTLGAQRGHAEVVEVLLQHEADSGRADTMGVTPLMWAATAGHMAVVKCLVRRRVDIDAHTMDGETALMLAARRGHFDIGRFLVRSGASLYPAMAQLEDGEEFSRLAPVISLGVKELHGAGLIAFARRLSPRMIAGIISVPGTASCHILDGLFERIDVLHPDEHLINTVTFCYMSGELHTAVDAAQVGSDGIAHLHECGAGKFAPTAPFRWQRKAELSEVRFLRCILPRIWDLEVIHAIAKSPNPQLFAGAPCKAILYHAWQEMMPMHAAYLVGKYLIVLCLMGITTAILSMNTSMDDIPAVWRWMVCILWLADFFTSVAEWIGQWRHEWRGHYKAIVEVPYAAVTMCLCVEFLFVREDHIAPWLRACLAAVSAWEWTDLMYAHFAFRAIGPQALPILVAMKEIRAFTGVMLLCLLACMHSYVTIAGVPVGTTLLRVWRLALVSDFEMDELHNDGVLPDGMEHIVDTFFLLMSFGFTVVLMNIFIGVVGNTYNAAVQKSEEAFLRVRADFTVRHTFSPLNTVHQWLRRALQCEQGGQMLWVCAPTNTVDTEAIRAAT